MRSNSSERATSILESKRSFTDLVSQSHSLPPLSESVYNAAGDHSGCELPPPRELRHRNINLCSVSDARFRPSFIRKDATLPSSRAEDGTNPLLSAEMCLTSRLPSIIFSLHLHDTLGRRFSSRTKRNRRSKRCKQDTDVKEVNHKRCLVPSFWNVSDLRSMGQILRPIGGTNGLYIPHIASPPSSSSSNVFYLGAGDKLQSQTLSQRRTRIEVLNLSPNLIFAVRRLIESNICEDSANAIQKFSGGYRVHSWSIKGGGQQLSTEYFVPPVKPNGCLELARTFRSRAQARHQFEGAIGMLITGCKMRRNIEAKCVYRGFLTNAVKDPKLFERRYLSMVKWTSSLKRKHSKTSEVCCLQVPPLLVPYPSSPLMSWECPPTEAALRCFAYRLSQAPSKLLLKNKRHPCIASERRARRRRQDLLAMSSGKKWGQCVKLVSILVRQATSLPSFVTKDDSSELTEQDPPLSSLINTVECFGEESIQVRGELLHLFNKSCEVAQEDADFLAELAVVGGGRANCSTLAFSPNMKSPIGGEIENETSLNLAMVDNVSVKNDPEYTPPQTNVISTESTNSQELTATDKAKAARPCKERKRKKETNRAKKEAKKAKKEERRLTKRKKKREKKELRVEKKQRISWPSALENPAQKLDIQKVKLEGYPPRIAAPSVPISSTPVCANPRLRTSSNAVSSSTYIKPGAVPIRKIPSRKEASDEMKETPTPQHGPECGSVESRNVCTMVGPLPKVAFLPLEVGITPVAARNLAEGQPFNIKRSLEQTMTDMFERDAPLERRSMAKSARESFSGGLKTNSVCIASTGPQTFLDKDGSIRTSPLRDENSAVAFHGFGDPSPKKTLRINSEQKILCSEHFLETSSVAVAELSSGRWPNSLFSESESDAAGGLSSYLKASSLAQKFNMIDCPLVDEAGIDIETSNGGSIIVVYLSSWSSDDGQASKSMIRRVVQLAATGRYESIYIFLCVDADITADVSSDITTLQNALVQQSGCPCEKVIFQFVLPTVLSASIAQTLLLAHQDVATTKIDNWPERNAQDSKIQEQARFLLSISPTLTVLGAFHFLWAYTDHRITSLVEEGDDALQKILKEASVAKRLDLFKVVQRKGAMQIRAQSMHQLSLAVNSVLSTETKI